MTAADPGRRFAVRAAFLGLVALTVTTVAAVYRSVLAADGAHDLDVVLVVVFSVLVTWTAWSFWAAALGALAWFGHGPRAPARRADAVEAPLPRTAVLLPVYQESPARLLAALRAMRASLRETGRAEAFDVFVLSDTRDAAIAADEEETWALVAADGAAPAVHYRRRAENRGRKPGNVADWCARWGAAYRYAVVLDADSLMEGATLVEMVRRMEADPRVALLQTAPRLANRDALFARLQQFGASVYGRVHLAGAALLTDGDANFWGHNAILRVRPFARHCGLPPLEGRPPLGGEILSHDFVEAALLRRAGFEVRLADDLGGSWEETPPTVPDHARRDARWCQGNLQHLRLLLNFPFHPMSAVHFATGAMAYLASPLWLVFLVLSVAAAATQEPAWTHDPAARRAAVVLLVVTLGMLLVPKLWGFLDVARDRRRLRAHGGFVRAAASVLGEVVASALLAPVFLVYHTRFVAATLAGRTVAWTTQRRDERGGGLGEAAREMWPHTVAGVAATAAVAALAPSLLPWLSPVLAGLVLSIPLTAALGSARLGRAFRRAGLLLTPEETEPSPLLVRYRAELTAASSRARLGEPVRRLVHADLAAAGALR